MINPMDLSGKLILITGASSGIGKACAIQCSKLGARVILVARNEDKLNETLKMMEGKGHVAYPFDLSQIDKIEELIKQIVQQNGALNGLVHCAGIAPMRPLALTKNNFLHDTMLINFYAFVELIRCASKKNNFIEGASFIGMSSISSKMGYKSKTAYCSSKAAMDAAARCMAKELEAKRIRVNTIIGGLIKTDMYNTYVNYVGKDAVNFHILDKQYMGIGETIDIANAVVFLLSDASKFITGTGLIVDGGYLS